MERNYDFIQHKDLRRGLDPKFHDVCDNLSAAYYNAIRAWDGPKIFQQGDVCVDFGKLVEEDKLQAKEIFDRYHGLIWWLYDIAFHNANMLLPTEKRIPSEKYADVLDETGTATTKEKLAKKLIAKLETEKGIKLVIQ